MRWCGGRNVTPFANVPNRIAPCTYVYIYIVIHFRPFCPGTPTRYYLFKGRINSNETTSGQRCGVAFGGLMYPIYVCLQMYIDLIRYAPSGLSAAPDGVFGRLGDIAFWQRGQSKHIPNHHMYE